MAKAKDDPTEEVAVEAPPSVANQPFTITVDGKVVWNSVEEAVDVMGVTITPDHGAVVDIPSPIGSVGISIVVNRRAESSTYLDKVENDKVLVMQAGLPEQVEERPASVVSEEVLTPNPPIGSDVITAKA